MTKWLSVLLLGIPLLMSQATARAATVYANTTGGRLISFDSSSPGTLLSDVPISGVAGGLVGIDFRPATPGTLVGVGNNGGAGSVYQINLLTGVATVIKSGFTLNGTSFGVDFNPVPNALRIVSNTGQNLRITAGGTDVVNTDGSLNTGGSPPVPALNVVAAAYTNNFNGATSTQLFVLQDNLTAGTDTLFLQNPPNDGTLTLPVTLSINVSQLNGFDITSTGTTNQAFLAWNGGNQFGTLDLTSGVAVNAGAIGGGFASQIVGISVLIPVPEPASIVSAGIASLFGVACLWHRRRTR
jgi:hypothetical protein